jgi:hypothetical protein
MEILLDYLVGPEVAEKAKGAGLAEGASHGAADLGRQACGHPAFRIGEQHCLDGRSLAESQLELDRAVFAGQGPGDDCREERFVGQARAFSGGKVAHVGK